MFTADNHKVTFILKTHSAAEGWGGEGEEGRWRRDGASARPPCKSLSSTFTSQWRGGRSRLEVLDGADSEQGQGSRNRAGGGGGGANSRVNERYGDDNNGATDY